MANVILAIIIQGLICALFLYTRHKNSFFLLHIYILVVCFDFLHELFIFQYFHQDTSYLDLIPGSFRLLKGPLLFLFTQQYINRPLAKKWVVLLFLPFLASFFTYAFLIVELILHNHIHDTLLHIHNFILKYYFYYWLGFILLSLSQLIRYGDRKDALFKWYAGFLSFLTVTVLTYYLAYRLGADKDMLRSVYNYLFFVQFALLAQLNLKYRSDAPTASIADELTRLPDRYQNSNLTEESLNKISYSIKDYLDDHADYTEEDFSLQQLSEKIGIPKHHISQAIADNLQTTFYELVNTYRLDLFIDRLHDDPSANVADLAYEVGFKSRTTFYKYFKTKTGLTPSEYKGKLKQISPKIGLQ